jgi:LysR substrate binding domain
VAGGNPALPSDGRSEKLRYRAGHRLAHRADVLLGELAQEHFVEGPPGWGIRVATDRAFGVANATRRITHDVGDIRSVVEFVHHGLAVAIAPPFVVLPGDEWWPCRYATTRRSSSPRWLARAIASPARRPASCSRSCAAWQGRTMATEPAPESRPAAVALGSPGVKSRAG